MLTNRADVSTLMEQDLAATDLGTKLDLVLANQAVILEHLARIEPLMTQAETVLGQMSGGGMMGMLGSLFSRG